ncbi:Two-component sensor histidine kinase, contains HisKA and HATPase domains [Spirosoma endophyticum]|uniref:histidine kinase n=2 Tax=Spirosoma endophyticum TaxID=662367 RepID=A0A1I1RNB1_9BACT|nr:Two-component sensor histidine kinase, contains HisKA and HATPase domains [Spirosoma endophyticum]
MAQEAPHLNVQPDKVRKAREVEQEARQKRDPRQLAEAWYLYGKAYVFAADYLTAQTYFLKAVRIHEPLGNSFELSRLYVRLCENEERLGHVEQALHYATLSLQVAQRIKLEKDQALIRSYGALAHIHETLWDGRVADKQSDYNKALSYYIKREFLCKKLNDTAGVAEVSLELGTLFTRVKDPRAIAYLEKALDLFTLKNKDGIRVNTMIHLASAYLTFGEPDRAIQSLENAKKLYVSKKMNEYDISLVMENNFVNYYETLGLWKQAFEHLRKFSELERIKLLADRDGAITRLSVEYETEKRDALLKAKNQEIALKNQTLLTQQRFTYAISALLIMALGMSIVFFRLYRKNQRISHRNEVLLKEQNHRVKNNLQIVSSLLNLQAKRLTDEVAKKAVEESRLRVQSMAIIHRRLYDGDKLAEVNLDEFIKELTAGVLKAFGYLFIKLEFAIDDINLSADKAISVGLILNELITNACKYAFPDNESPFLCITCYLKTNKIELKVEDNGPGIEGAMIAKTNSFGMTLIQAQVNQLYGTYRFSSGEKTVAKGTTFMMEFKR